MASFQLFLLTLVTALPPLFASPSPPLSVNVLFKAYSSERWNDNLIKNETLSQCYSAATAILVDFDHFWPGGLTLQSCPRKKILSDLVYIPWRGLYWHCNIFSLQSVTNEIPWWSFLPPSMMKTMFVWFLCWGYSRARQLAQRVVWSEEQMFADASQSLNPCFHRHPQPTSASWCRKWAQSCKFSLFAKTF